MLLCVSGNAVMIVINLNTGKQNLVEGFQIFFRIFFKQNFQNTIQLFAIILTMIRCEFFALFSRVKVYGFVISGMLAFFHIALFAQAVYIFAGGGQRAGRGRGGRDCFGARPAQR